MVCCPTPDLITQFFVPITRFFRPEILVYVYIDFFQLRSIQVYDLLMLVYFVFHLALFQIEEIINCQLFGPSQLLEAAEWDK